MVRYPNAREIMLGVLGVGLAGLLYSCGEVGGAGQCNGVEVTGACLTVDSIAPEDDGETTSDVDAFQTADCDGDPATVDPEGISRHQAVVNLSFRLMPDVSTPPAPSFVTVTGYVIEYTPSPTNTVSAPGLTPQVFGETITIEADGTVEAQLDLVPIQTKFEYVANGGDTLPAVYQAVYTFEGTTEFNQDFVLQGSTSFNIGSFNNCD